MTDINDQVSSFAAQLDALQGFEPLDSEQLRSDTSELVNDILNAPTHDHAIVVVRDFFDREGGSAYAHGVLIATFSSLGAWMAIGAPYASLNGADGLLIRFYRVAQLARTLGVRLSSVIGGVL